MAHFYFDESIQDKGAFIVGAFIFGPDAEAVVSEAIAKVGLKPGVDEFKSSARMSEHPEQIELRDELRDIATNYRIGVVVLPSVDRPKLGTFALQALDQFVHANDLMGQPDLEVFLDQGIFTSSAGASEIATTLGVRSYCRVNHEQDSRLIKGLQIADLVAHTSGLMLLDSLGLLKKVVKAGPNSGHDENLEIDLGFEMWARLRYQFFNAGSVIGQDDQYAGAIVKVGRNGLFIAPSCSSELRTSAMIRFDECYLGCIH